MNYANKKNIMVDKYTVWVGGIEVNDTFMPKEEAEELANSYRKQGYRDVHVERYHSITTTDKTKNNKWQQKYHENFW